MAAIENGRVAFVGLGIMGGPMAANLAKAGFELSVCTRTREKAEAFASEHGATRRRDPARGRRGRRRRDHDGPRRARGRGGPARRRRRRRTASTKGALAIDMSTIAPTAARAIGERLGDDGVAFLEAPVSGSRPKAEDGTLTIMVGGERDDFERARPLFEAMGERIVHVGPRGHGAARQAAHQHDGRRERRRAGRGGRRRRGARASIPTPSSRSPPAAPATRRCSP